MANITENTIYGSPGTQPSIANLSSLVKNLQQKTQQTSADTLKAGIVDHFYPNVAASMFSATKPVETPGIGTFPVGESIAPQQEGTKFEPIPGYEKFVNPDERNLWSLPSDKATLRNWPGALGGGQYVTDPTQRGALIKSERVLWDDELNPGARKAALGGLSSKLYQVDHIVPLWLGGSDTLANSQILDVPTHAKKTAVQSVPLTLLVNKKIDLNQAKLMALTWKDKDSSGLPSPDNSGYIPVDVAEKYAKKWQDDMTRSRTGEFFGESFKESMRDFGKGWLPKPISAFAKGLVSGGTAGIVPYTPSEEDTGLETVTSTAGNILGTITGLGLLSKGVGAALRGVRAVRGTGKAISLADEAMRTAGLASDIGSISSVPMRVRAETLKRMAQSAGLLSLWGQIGTTGREITGQQDTELKNHMTQFFTDVAFGGLLGASGQTVKGYATVGLGTTALSLMEGEEIVPALQNAALMTALHGMGYKKGLINPRTVLGNEEAFKMSANTFNQYLGDVVPRVKKGQGVPEILKLNIPKIDGMRAEYQQKYPNDQRFKGLGTITNETEAINFLEQASRRQLGNLIARSDGTIPQEEIKKEMTRIVVAKNQLYNQTLPPEARVQKEWQDLMSMGEKLRPQLKSEQLRPAINATKALEQVPVEFPQQTFSNPNGLKFPTGNVPTTGYGGNIDVTSKKTIDDYYNRTSDFSNKLYIVKDPETASVMRLIETEQIMNGQKPSVGNPDHALRVFIKEVKTDGVELRPVGYMPREESFNIKTDPLNKTYFEIRDRVRHTIETAKSAEQLRINLEQDKAIISINEKEASNLFGKKGKISDKELDTLLSTKAKNAYEKYDSALNNSSIAVAMETNGLNVLVADTTKVFPIGGGPPRYNPNNPYISLNLNEQDWLRSIALKNGEIQKTRESIQSIEKGIKDIKSQQKTEKVTKTTKDILKSDAVLNKPVAPSETPSAVPKTKSKKSEEKPGYVSLEELKARFDPETGTIKPKPIRYEKITPQKSDLVDDLYKDMAARIEEVHPDISSPQNHERSLMNVVRNFKRTNPGLPQNEFKKTMDMAKSRAGAYVRNLIDDAYKGTKVFGTDIDYTRQPGGENKGALISRYQELIKRGKQLAFRVPGEASVSDKEAIANLRSFEKTEIEDLKVKIKKTVELGSKINDIKAKAQDEKRAMTKAESKKIIELKKDRFTLAQDYMGGKYDSLVIANKYGLELTPPNDSGIRYLKLDKAGHPSFTPEFIKNNKLTEKDTPESIWGSFIKDDLGIYKDNLSKYSQEWAKGVDEMKVAKDPYAQGFAHALDAALKEKFGLRWRTSWKLNPALNPNKSIGGTKQWFNLANEEGYARSQPFRRTAAITAGRTPQESFEAAGKSDLITKVISEQARDKRLEALGRGQDISKSLPQGMRAKDESQIQNVSEDLTPFDMMMNGLLNAEVRVNLVGRYNNLRKEMGAGSAKYNEKVYDQMKLLFEQIKKLSVNTPEEVKKWDLGKKITLKNEGNPTMEEGVKDGLRLAFNIFSNKPSPGYVKFEGIRDAVLKSLKPKP